MRAIRILANCGLWLLALVANLGSIVPWVPLPADYPWEVQ